METSKVFGFRAVALPLSKYGETKISYIFFHIVFSSVFSVLPPSVLRFGGSKKRSQKAGPDLENIGFP